jgi:LPXTG-motif cell wall-anchored protein
VQWIEPEKFTFFSVVGAFAVIAGAIMVIRRRRLH